MNENYPIPMGSAVTLNEQQETSNGLPAGLQHYHRARVTIHYNSGVSDTGTLTYLDRTWAELLKDNGERLLIPLQSVRILKLMKVGETNADANMLLRAADAQPTSDNATKRIGSK